MRFEAPNTKNHSLYPERSSSNLDSSIELLKTLDSGKLEKINLSEQERRLLITFENELGTELENIDSIVSPTINLSLDYFLTTEGKVDFEQLVGEGISGETIQEIKTFLAEKRNIFSALPAEKRTAFAGRATTFSDKKTLSILSSSLNSDGSINIPTDFYVEKISFLVDPSKTLEKNASLRSFRRKIKVLQNAGASTESNNYLEAKKEILGLYKKRVNVMLANQFSFGVLIHNLREILPDSEFSEEEKLLESLYFGLQTPDKNYARYDKYLFGASAKYDETGNKEQLNEEILAYSKKIEDSFIFSELHKDDLIKERGLDPKKIETPSLDTAVFSAWEKEILDHYGELSSCPEKDYDPDRPGAATDNKWQFIARAETKALSVNDRKKTINSGIENKSIREVVAVLLGHETEGHFIQSINREKVPLKLFERLGGGRATLFAEGGAMMVQNEINQQAFGFSSFPHVHYIRAIEKKLVGGNYLDCVKAFHDSSLTVLQKKKEAGQITDEDFSKKKYY